MEIPVKNRIADFGNGHKTVEGSSSIFTVSQVVMDKFVICVIVKKNFLLYGL